MRRAVDPEGAPLRRPGRPRCSPRSASSPTWPTSGVHTGTLDAWRLTERGGWKSYPSLTYPFRIVWTFLRDPLSPTLTGQILFFGTVAAVIGVVLMVREHQPAPVLLYGLCAVAVGGRLPAGRTAAPLPDAGLPDGHRRSAPATRAAPTGAGGGVRRPAGRRDRSWSSARGRCSRDRRRAAGPVPDERSDAATGAPASAAAPDASAGPHPANWCSSAPGRWCGWPCSPPGSTSGARGRAGPWAALLAPLLVPGGPGRLGPGVDGPAARVGRPAVVRPGAGLVTVAVSRGPASTAGTSTRPTPRPSTRWPPGCCSTGTIRTRRRWPAATRLLHPAADFWTYQVDGAHTLGVSYPAGSFLLQAPVMALGLTHMVTDWVDLAAWLVTAVLIFCMLPSALRWLAPAAAPDRGVRRRRSPAGAPTPCSCRSWWSPCGGGTGGRTGRRRGCRPGSVRSASASPVRSSRPRGSACPSCSSAWPARPAGQAGADGCGDRTRRPLRRHRARHVPPGEPPVPRLVAVGLGAGHVPAHGRPPGGRRPGSWSPWPSTD